MNNQIFSAFLAPAVQDACAALQLQDRTTDQILTTDSRVALAAKMAYAMISSYTNRQFIKDTYTEYYLEADTRIRLRNYPISIVYTVQLVDNPHSDILTDPTMSAELVEDTDFSVRGDKDLIFSLDSLSSLSVGDSSHVHVYVEYIGGYVLSSDEHIIHLCLVTQTIANYNRLPVLGLAQLQGNESTSRGASGQINLAASPDAGDLLESVKTMLAPYVYQGEAMVA